LKVLKLCQQLTYLKIFKFSIGWPASRQPGSAEIGQAGGWPIGPADLHHYFIRPNESLPK
jgi:hypothetical protein